MVREPSEFFDDDGRAAFERLQGLSAVASARLWLRYSHSACSQCSPAVES